MQFSLFSYVKLIIRCGIRRCVKFISLGFPYQYPLLRNIILNDKAYWYICIYVVYHIATWFLIICVTCAYQCNNYNN